MATAVTDRRRLTGVETEGVTNHDHDWGWPSSMRGWSPLKKAVQYCLYRRCSASRLMRVIRHPDAAGLFLIEPEDDNG